MNAPLSILNIAALAEAAAKVTDMTKATAGGGDFEPLAAGPCRLRFVGYIETGKQKGTYLGKPTEKLQVALQFEVSGPKHPPRKLEDGTEVPNLITIEENFSMSEKATLFKLFGRMNYSGKATHMVALLGDAFLGTIYHRTYKGRDGKDRIAVDLKSKEEGYSIRPPRRQDENDEWVPVPVAPAKSPIKAFIWTLADLGQWNSIFIDGEYPERKDDKGVVTAKAKSKNVWQNKIKSAMNFQGSPIYDILAANGQSVDIPLSTQDMDEEEAPAGDTEPPFDGGTKVNGAKGDPLAGIAE